MSVQLRTSTYTEEFRCPPRGKPARPRPCSANRRNNPHPRPDFLLPRRLQTGYGARPTATPQTTLDYGSLLFPPLRHVSFPCQGTADPGAPQLLLPLTVPGASNSLLKGKPQSLRLCPGSTARPATRQPALNSAHRSLTPSTGQLCKPDPVASPLREKQFQNSPKYTEGKMESHKSCVQSNGHLKEPQCLHSDIQTHIGQGNRGILGSEILKEPISKQHDNTTLSRHPKSRMYFKKSCSTLDPSAGYSCFQVVKPYKTGYYIIHPEFISESRK